jgi:hypothetical protein
MKANLLIGFTIVLRLCLAAQITPNWLLVAMFVKLRPCVEVIELIDLGLVSITDVEPYPAVLKKGFHKCKDTLLKHQFAIISQEEKMFYDLASTIAVQDLVGLLSELSVKSGTSLEVQAKRVYLLACAAGNVAVIDQIFGMVPSRIKKLGFVLACSRMQQSTVTFLLKRAKLGALTMARAMKLSCLQGSASIVPLLLDHFKHNDKDTKYVAAAAFSGSLELVKLLIADDRFNKPNDINDGLQWSIRRNFMEIADWILGENEHLKPYAFRLACKHSEIDFVKEMLENNKELPLQQGFNSACKYGRMDVVLMLLESGHVVVDSEALYFAACSGNLDLVAWVMQQPEIDVNFAGQFAAMVKDGVPLKVLELIMMHKEFTIHTLLSAFQMDDANLLLCLPVTHRLLFEFSGDIITMASSCGATSSGLIDIFSHPCVATDQILLEDDQTQDQLQIITTCKSGELEKFIDTFTKKDLDSSTRIGIQCAAFNEQKSILVYLLQNYISPAADESIRGARMLRIDSVVIQCRSLKAISSVKIVWEWLGQQFPLIHTLMERLRPLQTDVICRRINNITMNERINEVCLQFAELIEAFGIYENLAQLAISYRNHFLIMVNIHEICPAIPLEYSDEMLMALLKDV